MNQTTPQGYRTWALLQAAIDFGRAVSRILSASLAEWRRSFISAVIPETRPAEAGHGAGRSRVFYLALHPMGFSVPPRSLLERWALTPPFHPCPTVQTSCAVGRFVFCGTVRRHVSQRNLPLVSRSHGTRLSGIAPYGVRTFLPWLAPGAIFRPSKIKQNLTRYGPQRNGNTRILLSAPGCGRSRPQR